MIAYTNYATEGRARVEAETLVGWGWEVFFLVPKDGARPRSHAVRGVTVKELNTRKYCGKRKLGYVLSYLIFLALAFSACTRLFIQSRINVVHVHNMPDFLVFAGLLPRLFGRRLILDVHDSVPETYIGKFGRNSGLIFDILRFEESICCRLVHKVICVNHVQREALVKRGISSDKIATILSVPGFTSQKCAPAKHNAAQIFRMVYHGSITRRLGVDLIVQAVAKLVHRIAGLQLHIYGEGDDLDEVVRLTRSLGIADYVHFHGIVPWETLPQELEAMDVGIVGNRTSVATQLMLPVKLIDYVALDIPAIAPRLRTIEYYFSQDMVSFFEPENVDSMVDATLNLYGDSAHRKRQAQRAKAFLEKYGWDNQQNALRGVYDGL